MIALVAISTLLQADYVIKYNMDGDITEFMYKNSSTSKMITHSDSKTEIYNIKKNSYIVTHEDNDITIVDVNKMRAKAKEMGFDPSAFAAKQEAPKFTIEKTGKKERLGGINGEVWILKGEEDGEKYETKVVVTDDKRVVKTVRAMFNSISTMSGGMVGEVNFFELKKGYITIKADGMKLVSFKNKSLPQSTYTLPKVPKKRTSNQKKSTTKVKAKAHSEPKEETLSDKDIQEATDMLKSFF